MANTLTAIIPKILAAGMLSLRQFAIMPRLVNRRIEADAGKIGSTVDVPIPSAIAARDVVPANTTPAGVALAPTSVPVVLDQWKEAPFEITDKEARDVELGRLLLPMAAGEAIKSLANAIDTYLIALAYKAFYGFHGTPGTTPFGSGTTVDATSIRKILNKQLAPMGDRYVVMNPDCEAQALDIRAFQDGSYSGNVQAIIEGDLNRKLGFNWFMDQNIDSAAYHTKGTSNNAYLVNNVAGYNIGDKNIVIDTGAGTHVVGDIVTFAGHTQTYVVTEALAGVGTLKIEPGLVVAVADNTAITTKASHVNNLAFHRDAIAFATRPLTMVEDGLGSMTQVANDPISGLSLRLEVKRGHKQTIFSYDVLYGGAVPRRELGARLAG